MIPLIFERSVSGRRALTFPRLTEAEREGPLPLPAEYCADEAPDLPEVSELDVIRHYTRLSQQNYSVDTHFYPLGSCTMKYNPRLCEKVAALDGFAGLHPLLPQLRGGAALTQGALEVLWHSGELLNELTGMAGFTLQPMAGAHGELTGMLLIAAYHRARGDTRRTVLIPDSAHGTNPASAAMVGYSIVAVGTDADGNVDLDDFKARLTPDTAAVMLTCPSTLGALRDPRARTGRHRPRQRHPALLRRRQPQRHDGTRPPRRPRLRCGTPQRPQDLGTPHGGGGPGAYRRRQGGLLPFLPAPIVTRSADGTFALDYDRPQSIGYIAPFYGNFGVMLRAYAYMLHLGGNGLREAADHAVLNANYLRVRLQEAFDIPYNRICMHEVLLSAGRQHKTGGIRALDFAKGLIDAGFHPPTIYFPLIVHEAMMIEPTETESKATLDAFADALLRLARLAETDPGAFATMPESTHISRVDETRAARSMVLKA